MNYLNSKYSSEKLNQRAFILSSFSRMKMNISVDIYEFVDYIIGSNWLPILDTIENVDKEILEKFNEFVSHKRN